MSRSNFNPFAAPRATFPLGRDAKGRPIRLTEDDLAQTHTHVIGGTSTGKSSFLDWFTRQFIRQGKGVCVLDWHGTLYQNLVRYSCQLDIGLHGCPQKLFLLNPSDAPRWITGFNPFARQGPDISAGVSRRIDATIRPWGMTDTNEMPTFERICRAVFTFMAEQQETLPNVNALLEFGARNLRDYAARTVADPHAQAIWRELQTIKTARDWQAQVTSTANRFSRLVSASSLRRFMGLQHGNIDISEIMDSGGILLVNLAASDYLPTDARRVFASLLLNEFFEAAMRRAKGGKPRPFVLVLDEFQEYCTDVGSMLDSVRKGGLHMVLAHQHLGHFAENPRLQKAVMTNARIRLVFGALDYEDSCLLANEMFLPDLNTRQIKKAYYHMINVPREETRTVLSHSSSSSSSRGGSKSSGQSTGRSGGTGAGTGLSFHTELPHLEGWFGPDEGNISQSESSSDGWADSENESSGESWSEGESETDSETVVPVWVPIPVQELGHETEWSREEKLSKVAEMLSCQQQRHCFIKLGTKKVQPMQVPFVKPYPHPKDFLLEFEAEIAKITGAIPAAEADRLIAEAHRRFLRKAFDYFHPGAEHDDGPEETPFE